MATLRDATRRDDTAYRYSNLMNPFHLHYISIPFDSISLLIAHSCCAVPRVVTVLAVCLLSLPCAPSCSCYAAMLLSAHFLSSPRLSSAVLLCGAPSPRASAASPAASCLRIRIHFLSSPLSYSPFLASPFPRLLSRLVSSSLLSSHPIPSHPIRVL